MTQRDRQRAMSSLRIALSALIASSACNACSAPTPPQPATQAPDAAPAPSTPADMPATPPPPAPEPVAPEPAATEPATTEPVASAPPKTATPPPRQAAAPPPADEPPQPTSIVIYTLSRGKGVPAETRAAAKQIRALLEQRQQASVVTALHASRIGLEGETRLCAEFGNREDAQAALADIRKLSSGVDMINVVEEPCPSPKDKAP